MGRRPQQSGPALQGQIITINARQLTEHQDRQISEFLQNFGTSELAIFTPDGDAERSLYAGSLEHAFQLAGWHVRRFAIDRFERREPGVLLIRHSGRDTPDLRAIKQALLTAEVPHREIHIGDPAKAGFYKRGRGVETSVPVIFIGPAA